jgi:hypothetical protein
MAGRQHEAVAIRPDRVIGIEAQEALPETVDDRRQRHRRPRMAGVGLLYGVRIDTQPIDVLLCATWPEINDSFRTAPLHAANSSSMAFVYLANAEALTHLER